MFDRLRLSIDPSNVVPVSPVAVVRRWCCVPVAKWLLVQWLLWLLLGAPVAAGGVDASVDTDDYQKRSPVENVLDSTGNSRVIVSNRVHGKHSIRW